MAYAPHHGITVRDRLTLLAMHLVAKTARCASDRRGSTMTEYALTVAGLGLSTMGLSSAIGVELGQLLNAFGYEICLQTAQVCTGR